MRPTWLGRGSYLTRGRAKTLPSSIDDAMTNDNRATVEIRPIFLSVMR